MQVPDGSRGTIVHEWECVDRVIRHRMVAVSPDGQVRWLGDTEQGPFDTALELAQWAWRLIAKELPSSGC